MDNDNPDQNQNTPRENPALSIPNPHKGTNPVPDDPLPVDPPKPDASLENVDLEVKPTDQDGRLPADPPQDPPKNQDDFRPLEDSDIEKNGGNPFLRQAYRKLREEHARLRTQADQSKTSTEEAQKLRQERDDLQKQLTEIKTSVTGTKLPEFKPEQDPEIVALRDRLNAPLKMRIQTLGSDGAKVAKNYQQWLKEYSKVNWEDPDSVAAFEDKLEGEFQNPSGVQALIVEYASAANQLSSLAADRQKVWGKTLAEQHKVQATALGEKLAKIGTLDAAAIKAAPLSPNATLSNLAQQYPQVAERIKQIREQVVLEAFGPAPRQDSGQLSQAELEAEFARHQELATARENWVEEIVWARALKEIVPKMQQTINRLSERNRKDAKDQNIPSRDDPNGIQVPTPNGETKVTAPGAGADAVLSVRNPHTIPR